jgi:hypothetical protein
MWRKAWANACIGVGSLTLVTLVYTTVPPAFAPSRDSGRLAPPGMIAAGCGSKVDEMRGLRRSGDFRAA